MEITPKQIAIITGMYQDNKETLAQLEETIRQNGITDDGITDAANSFEQGYNNAIEQLCNVLGIQLPDDDPDGL